MREQRAFLISMALLVGSSVPAASQSDECVDERCVVGEFTGRLEFDSMCESVDVAGLACNAPAVVEPFSDVRLDGDIAITGWSRDIGDTAVLWFGSWLIGDSDEGWIEVASPHLQHRDGTPTQYTSVLVGTGAYEGLHAVSEVTVSGADFDFEGHIVAGTIEPGVTDFSGVVMPGGIAELDW